MTTNGRRRGGTAPTIAEVARHAGVSSMTVSRVIRQEGRVGADARAAVLAAVAALGYQPNLAARQLAGAAPVRVGLLFANPSAAYLSEFLMGGLDEAGRGNLQLVVEKCGPDDDEGEATHRLLAGGADGLVLPPPLGDNPRVLAALRASGRPGVAVGTSREADEVSVVAIDDRAAAAGMTRHLLALGHRRIGFVGGDPNQTVSADRLAGYRDAFAAGGLAVDEALATPGRFTYRSGLAAAERLLDLPAPPTAIFASNDDMAAAAVATAHRRGLDVPGDLAVCGFDDTALATTIWPELTTIRQPIDAMARAAFRLLADTVRRERTNEPRRCERIVCDHMLVRRASDGPARP